MNLYIIDAFVHAWGAGAVSQKEPVHTELLEGVNVKLGAKSLNKEGKPIFVCPFCTMFTKSLADLIAHFRADHSEEKLRAYAEQQRLPKKDAD